MQTPWHTFTILLIIYNAGSFADGPNDEVISHIHDKVACNDYIITHKLKIQLTREDLMMRSTFPSNIIIKKNH